MPVILYLRTTRSTRLGHGGLREEESYSVLLNDFHCYNFSSTYHGSGARSAAEKYAEGLSQTLGIPIVRVRSK